MINRYLSPPSPVATGWRTAGLLCATLLFASAPAGAQELARSGFYAGFELGTVIPGEWDTDGMDNDVGTACDDWLFSGGRLETMNCGSGDVWTNEIEFDSGVLGGLQLGWFHDRFRFELEYAYSDLGGDRGGINELIAGKENEFAYENEKFENISSHDLFLNAYMDFPARLGITTYLGFGVGWRQMELDYTGTYLRNTYDFFTDPANMLDDRREAAGTVSRIEEELDDDVFGYQFIAGADYALNERLTVGAKLRYTRFQDFDGGSHEYAYLRSHDSNTSPGPGHPKRDLNYPAELDRTVRNKIEIDDVDSWAVSLNLKYAFGGSAHSQAAARAASAGDERSGMYVGFDLGMAFPEDFDTEEGDNDVATRCDTYVTDTRTQPCGSGDDWSVGVDPDSGILGGVHIGWLHGNWRTEIEYFYQAVGGDRNAIPIGGLPAGKDREILLASEAIDNVTGHNLFANVYYDFVNASRFTPYVGVGVGWQRMKFDHDIAFVRNTREIFEDLALNNIIEAAGTITRVEQTLDDDMFGYQLLAGADYALSERFAVGAKLRYTRFDEFDGGSYAYDELRSHPSRTGRPSDAGSRPVRATFETDEIETWGVSLNVKYLF